MALLFLVYAKLWDNSVLLSVYLTLLLLSVVVFHRLRSHQWFSKHLIYRALAETMRIKFFLRAAGADRLVSATELINLTAIDQFPGFSWIGNVLKNVESLDARDERRRCDGTRAPAERASSLDRRSAGILPHGACARSSAIIADWKC